MDKSVANFYKKNQEEGYAETYDQQHGPRINFVVQQFQLNKIKNSRILDAGCGLGNFFKRLDKSNKFIGLDGADIAPENLLCDFTLFRVDLNKPIEADIPPVDYCICSETLEHLTDDYTCLVELKKLVKQYGTFIITIPAAPSLHNWIRPGHMHPKENFEVFLEQMAFKITEYAYWNGWCQAHCWKLINLPWEDSKMIFPKQEEKFRGKTPLECVNL